MSAYLSEGNLMTDRFKHCVPTRHAVPGDNHVDPAEAGNTDFDEPFQTLITESAWGTLWASDALTPDYR
jgi:4-carboxymuconolactone decarboxylase